MDQVVMCDERRRWVNDTPTLCATQHESCCRVMVYNWLYVILMTPPVLPVIKVDEVRINLRESVTRTPLSDQQ